MCEISFMYLPRWRLPKALFTVLTCIRFTSVWFLSCVLHADSDWSKNWSQCLYLSVFPCVFVAIYNFDWLKWNVTRHHIEFLPPLAEMLDFISFQCILSTVLWRKMFLPYISNGMRKKMSYQALILTRQPRTSLIHNSTCFQGRSYVYSYIKPWWSWVSFLVLHSSLVWGWDM